MNTTFTINEYEKQDTFAGFLPGLSGIHGIPIWCYYVNRGQCISSFGVEDKDHAIMEFFPAHQSYRETPRAGFRTFVKMEGKVSELFTGEETVKKMHVHMNGLSIEEENKALGLHTRVDYITLPEERTGALVRKVTITNISGKDVHMELVDGMPVVIPYGISLGSVKDMGHTSMAWMQVEDVEKGVPFFRARASMADTATVNVITGGNYGVAVTEKGERCKVIVDPKLVFFYDDSFGKPIGFEKHSLRSLLGAAQVVVNQYPCLFFGKEADVKAGESLVLYEVIGQVSGKEKLERFLEKELNSAYFEEKYAVAERLPMELTEGMDTHTGNADFDAYCRYTYMDNILRGGYPITLPGGKIFYVYSRKHGDLERDYNYFRMLPEFYTQGNGNFRDVNQNRRCDTFFCPYVDKENIVKFYSLIQLDGYNPLSIEKVTYTLAQEQAGDIFDALSQEQKEELLSFLEKPFTPGGFYQKLEEVGVLEEGLQESFFTTVMEQAEGTTAANFGEGYWSDHWTYNLDLIESYLQMFPDKEEELLKTPVTYYRSQVPILPRRKRYVKTENGIRQHHFLDHTRQLDDAEKLLKDKFGQGEVVESTLLEKLLLLCLTKYSALDAYGMGVEMEGGKPGWYDALNGMPALFGSSMAETCELLRMMNYTVDVLEKYGIGVDMLAETAAFMKKLGQITENAGELSSMDLWNQRCDVKEYYWEQTFTGISGAREEYSAQEILAILKPMRDLVETAVKKACDEERGVCPTYFTYEVKKYRQEEDGIYPEEFVQQSVPLFLEGAVRYLKLPVSLEEKNTLYNQVRERDLYDEKLGMYKVNASLKDASYELGRARAFTPGWLENESIWLHMEYKYLLELLKSGMYEKFAKDFHRAAVPFLDPKVYGRSIYENSSFIASSKNPNPAYHGRGFVARLSGSTAEFLQMWILMMFGRLFAYEEGELTCRFTPMLPAYLIGENHCVEATLCSKTRVIYALSGEGDFFPGQYETESMELYYEDGSVYRAAGEVLRGNVAQDVRNGKVSKIFITLKK